MIWLVGAKGMLGTDLALALSSCGLNWVGTDRDLDIRDPGLLRRFASGKAFRWIVNCAAYTAVDKAESEPARAAELNVEGPQNLARLANALGARLLHLSTDYVFSGDATRPYREEDPILPRSVYGHTKAEGEAKVRESLPRAVIVRTAWLFGEHGSNFIYTMLRLMRQKDQLGVVTDQIGSPTWTVDLAAAIIRILQASEPKYGTYHFTCAGETSWYEFAKEILRLGRECGIVDKDCTIRAISSAEYPAVAKRPSYSVLSKEKIIRDYGVAVPDWRKSIEQFLKNISRSFAEDLEADQAITWDAWLNARSRLLSA